VSDKTPRPTDDRETAARKSGSIDGRAPHREAAPTPGIDVPGAPTLPYAGLGATTDVAGTDRSPGELVLDQEQAAQRSPIQRG